MSEHSDAIGEQPGRAKAKIAVAGVDIGAVTSKAVILLDGHVYASSQVATRTPKESASAVLNAVLDTSGLKLKDIRYVVATGRGRSQVPIATKTVSEIACAAAGAVHVWGPSVRTVLDGGGQSCRVIQCTEKGRVTDFLWNDKCAAGIGRSLETFADLVRKDMAEIGKTDPQPGPPLRLSDFCSVYAQSEALDLIRSKVPTEQVIAAYHYAMAKRISTLAARAGVRKNFVIIGGLAKNPGITDRVESILNVGRLAPKAEWDPALTTALGSALLAHAFCGDV